MAERKAYPLRINADVLDAMQRWADDELRSLNAQIEYVLRDALRRGGRVKHASTPDDSDDNHSREAVAITAAKEKSNEVR
jgi:hypothetical protein